MACKYDYILIRWMNYKVFNWALCSVVRLNNLFHLSLHHFNLNTINLILSNKHEVLDRFVSENTAVLILKLCKGYFIVILFTLSQLIQRACTNKSILLCFHNYISCAVLKNINVTVCIFAQDKSLQLHTMVTRQNLHKWL